MTSRLRTWSATTSCLVAVIVVMSTVARLPSFVHQLFSADEAAIAAQAISLRDGGTLYVDAIDRKPPLPPYLYSWSFELFGNTDLRPLHALAAVALAGAALAVALDARRRAGAAGGWWAAALLVGGAVAFYPDNAQAANYAHFALFPGAVAVVAARRGTTRSALLAGIALGAAILCRQTWAIGVLPAVVGSWLNGRPRDAALLVVATLVTVSAIGIDVPLGAFWHWTFASNDGFLLDGVHLRQVVRVGWHASWLFVVFHLALVALVAAAAWLRLRDRGAWRADLDLWLWLATAGIAVTAGFRFYGHYWLQALPPAVALAAPVVTRLRRLMQGTALAATLAATAIAVAMAFTPGTYRPMLNPEPLAAYVDAHSTPGQRILMWGDYPEIYWSADRPPAGGFVHSGFVTGFSGQRASGLFTLADAAPGARSTFIDSLHQHPPALIVDTSTTDLRHYGLYPMSVIPELAAFVAAHYRRGAIIHGITIYRRDDP